MSCAIPVSEIIRICTEEFEVSKSEILNPGRARRVFYPRAAIWDLVRQFTTLSFPAIGRMFARDHATVINGVNKSQKLLQDKVVIEDYCDRFERALARIEWWNV